MTIVATGFLFFVYFFDWIIYGRSKFTLVREENKTKCKSRSFPVTKATIYGAQDLNRRVKVKLDDSYFVVDTTYGPNDAPCTRLQCTRPLCLETNNFVTDITSSKKFACLIQLGVSSVLLERPYGQSVSVPTNRIVA